MSRFFFTAAPHIPVVSVWFRLGVNPAHVTWKEGFACESVMRKMTTCEGTVTLSVSCSSSQILWNTHWGVPLVLGPRSWITYPWLHRIKQHASLLIPMHVFSLFYRDWWSFTCIYFPFPQLHLCFIIFAWFVKACKLFGSVGDNTG